MRKHLLVITFICLSLSLIACNDSKNSISEAELTDSEKGILSATTDQSFVFDFNVDSTYKELSVWVEKYEFGELVNDQLGNLNSGIPMNGQIMFSILDTHDPQGRSVFNIAIIDEDGSGRISFTEKVPKDYSSTWGSNQWEDIPITDEIVLASMVYSNASHMSSLSADFYSDMENHLEEVKDYDVVYLLKGKFIK